MCFKKWMAIIGWLVLGSAGAYSENHPVERRLFDHFYGFANAHDEQVETGIVFRTPLDPMTHYEIDDFHMKTKTITVKEHIAIVATVSRGPDYYIYAIRKGSLVGKNYGQVMELEDDYMLIREIHSCGKEKWQLKWLTFLAVPDGYESSKFVKFREVAEPCD